MDFFMPAERVLYDRSYYFSDEAVEEYTAEVADQNGVDTDEVASSAELMVRSVRKSTTPSTATSPMRSAISISCWMS